MSQSIVVPPLGGTETPLTVSMWFVRVGDEVAVGDRVVEILAPGMTFDVSAPGHGTVTEITTREGATVAVGDVLGKIADGADAN